MRVLAPADPVSYLYLSAYPSSKSVRSLCARGVGSSADLLPLPGDPVRVPGAYVEHLVVNPGQSLPNHVHSIPLAIVLGSTCDLGQRKAALRYLITPIVLSGTSTCHRCVAK